MGKYTKHTTQDVLETALELFEQHPELPNDWSLSAAYGQRHISYCYIDGEGKAEMRAIVKSLGAEVKVSNSRATVEHMVKVNRKTVRVTAQMEIVEEPVKVKESTKARVMAELMGDN